ncbi:hypothetical protein [Streptomyces sp. NPDC046887]|uniref:hypothetical protein n=1 Tax=Streptomyces sp. NPDC046887 TaxID=3155472 RepID=UPI0033E17BFF
MGGTNDGCGAPEANYSQLVAHYSAPERVGSALERVKAEARRRAAVRALVVRARGGVLHNHTVREVARYFRGEERGRVDLLQVSRATGVPLGDCRQVLREFTEAGLLREYAEPAGEHGELVRRSYELAEGGRGGMTEVFVETEAGAGARRAERGTRMGGAVGWEGTGW